MSGATAGFRASRNRLAIRILAASETDTLLRLDFGESDNVCRVGDVVRTRIRTVGLTAVLKDEDEGNKGDEEEPLLFHPLQYARKNSTKKGPALCRTARQDGSSTYLLLGQFRDEGDELDPIDGFKEALIETDFLNILRVDEFGFRRHSDDGACVARIAKLLRRGLTV